MNQFAAIDSRVILFRNIENRGTVFTYNYLFTQAKGDFILVQDADDWSDLLRIEKILTFYLAILIHFIFLIQSFTLPTSRLHIIQIVNQALLLFILKSTGRPQQLCLSEMS
jgi:glycosyltransferase involved in cell wall biosynthesis